MSWIWYSSHTNSMFHILQENGAKRTVVCPNILKHQFLCRPNFLVLYYLHTMTTMLTMQPFLGPMHHLIEVVNVHK